MYEVLFGIFNSLRRSVLLNILSFKKGLLNSTGIENSCSRRQLMKRCKSHLYCNLQKYYQYYVNMVKGSSSDEVKEEESPKMSARDYVHAFVSSCRIYGTVFKKVCKLFLIGSEKCFLPHLCYAKGEVL